MCLDATFKIRLLPHTEPTGSSFKALTLPTWNYKQAERPTLLDHGWNHCYLVFRFQCSSGLGSDGRPSVQMRCQSEGLWSLEHASRMGKKAVLNTIMTRRRRSRPLASRSAMWLAPTTLAHGYFPTCSFCFCRPSSSDLSLPSTLWSALQRSLRCWQSSSTMVAPHM